MWLKYNIIFFKYFSNTLKHCNIYIRHIYIYTVFYNGLSRIICSKFVIKLDRKKLYRCKLCILIVKVVEMSINLKIVSKECHSSYFGTHCVYARTRVYYGRARNASGCKTHQCNAINTNVTPIMQRVNRDVLPRENQNYPCPTLFASRMFLARPIPVVSQPVLPIALKFQIISLNRGAPAAPICVLNICSL